VEGYLIKRWHNKYERAIVDHLPTSWLARSRTQTLSSDFMDLSSSHSQKMMRETEALVGEVIVRPKNTFTVGEIPAETGNPTLGSLKPTSTSEVLMSCRRQLNLFFAICSP
jgi:hypothetical protein